jgi:hypothetical protein
VLQLLASGADVAIEIGGVAAGHGVPSNVQSMGYARTVYHAVADEGVPFKEIAG